MTTTQSEERVAILLSLLGRQVAEPVLSQLDGARRAQMNELLDSLENEPPDDDEVEAVVDEFERFFRFANDALKSENEPPAEANPEPVAAASEPDDEDKPFEITDDTIADLNRLQPFQIAGALNDEQPRTTGVVMNCLNSDLASATLAEFAPEKRNEVFLQLTKPAAGAAHLIKRIVKTVVERAATIRRDAIAPSESESDRKLAELLRSMERSQRNDLLAVLENDDPEIGERIRGCLYVFEDVKIIDDSSLQKLLREIELSTLAKALKGAEEEISDKVKRNLARRARESLNEEMDLMNSPSPEEQEAARNQIVGEISRLDQAGQLQMST